VDVCVCVCVRVRVCERVARCKYDACVPLRDSFLSCACVVVCVVVCVCVCVCVCRVRLRSACHRDTPIVRMPCAVALRHEGVY